MEVAEILQKLGISPVRETTTEYWSHCPNPNHPGFDKTPSWHINKETGQHNCFGCELGGSIYSLIKTVSKETPSKLLGESGFSFTKPNIHNVNNQQIHSNKTTKRSSQSLNTKPEVNFTIQGTEHTPYEYSHVVSLLRKLHIGRFFIDTFNLSYVRYARINNTDFADRLLFKVYEEGKLVNIEGRDASGDQTKKVIYPIGSISDTLWNYDNLSPEKPLIVCEGIKDTIKIWQHYSTNVTSMFGATLKKRQRRMLRQFPNIILFPDNDAAGLHLVSQFNDYFETQNVFVALSQIEGTDPADLRASEISKCIDNAVPSTVFEQYSLKRALEDDL